MRTRKGNYNPIQEISSHQKKPSKSILDDVKSTDLQKDKPTFLDIETSQIYKNFHYVESDLIRYPYEIVKQIIADSPGKAWRGFFDWLSARFSWVYTHSINVAIMSVMFATELGYNRKSLQCIALGGLLHDVGKLLVPASIIQKKSFLDDEEMALIKKHCELGMSLVESCGLSEDCIAVILQHHERLDGSGYPFGLKSDKIHPYAKIAMIADVLDAITSYRPYRPAKNISEAIQIIKDEGPKFSVTFVSAIERLLLNA